MERRKFIAGAGSVLAGTSLAYGQGKKKGKKSKDPVILFEKPIQAMPYGQMGEELAKLGVQGIEATIRKKGHIEPGNAKAEVPKMVADLAKNGQKAIIAATSIKTASKDNEELLRILKDNGIEKYRLDYYRYDLKKDLLPQLEAHTAQLHELCDLNRRVGIQGIYQLHSGFRMAGSLGWDMAMMLDGVDPKETAIGFDLRHVRTDGGLSFDVIHAMMKKHIGALYVKDAQWSDERNEELERVALDTGFVNEKMYRKVRKGLPPMPVSLHLEWGAKKVYPVDQVEEPLRFFARDLEVLRSWM